MKTKTLKLIIFLLLTAPAAIFSQDKNGGSVYSIYGLGNINYSVSSRTDGMNILGLSLLGDYSNSLTPAALTKINHSLFSTRISLEGYFSDDGSGKSKRVYSNFDGFNLSVPILPKYGFAFDLGLNKFSIVNYDIKVRKNSLGEYYTQYYRGNGGLNRFSASLSYLMFRHISVGVQFNYAFGDISKTTQIDFDNSNLFDTRNRLINSISGYYFNTGIIFGGFDKLLRSKNLESMNIGFFFSSPAVFNSKISGIFETANETDTLDITYGKIDIPLSFGAGISNEFNNRLTLSADFLYQNWDKFKYYGAHPQEIVNSFRIGFGSEFRESKKSDASFLKKISYRLGVSYQSEYTKIGDIKITSYSASAGLSLPISNFNRLDLLFSYMRRGKISDGLVTEDIFRVGAAINIGELWFIRPKDY